MKGDFTRSTFDARKHFTRVLMQQGRVQLDADWNEQAAILLHYLQTLAADLIGPDGGPAGACGFEIKSKGTNDFTIGPGHYYVDGILCENKEELAYTAQPDYPLPDDSEFESDKYLVYLDVWERHISYIEDEGIREVALDGPDTATRAKVVWQVKVVPVELEGAGDGDENAERIKELTQQLEDLRAKLEAAKKDAEKAGMDPEDDESIKELDAEIQKVRLKLRRLHQELVERGKLAKPYLRARAYVETPWEDPCVTPPEARYRGAENQLYRVEIHGKGGEGVATFKWSRDNGSVIFPIIGISGDQITLEHLGRDDRLSLEPDDVVEVVADNTVLRGEPGPLFNATRVDRVERVVTLELRKDAELPDYDSNSHFETQA
jgi:hypothetical protein